MTTGEVKQVVKRHRPAALFGGIAGVLLIAGWFGYDIAMTPSRPDVATAKAAEMVNYISNSRGLARLAQVEQEQFLDQWKTQMMKPGRDAELKECLDEINEDQRQAFADAVFRQAKRAFMDDAKKYAEQSTPQQRNDFIRDRLTQYAQDAAFTKKVAGSFRGSGPKSQDEMQKWVIEHTTPEERAIGEPYVEALKRVREVVKKEQRGAQVSATSPGNS